MKKFVCGVVVGMLGALSISVIAAGSWDTIDVLRNDITVVVNGENVTADNFLYNDTTYIPLRAVSEALNQAVTYDETTNTAYIGERNDNVIKSKHTPPPELLDRGEIILYNDIYYYDASSADFALYSTYGIKPEMLSESNPDNFIITNKNGERRSWKLTDIRNDSYYYIPYDTFVDEILPFVEAD